MKFVDCACDRLTHTGVIWQRLHSAASVPVGLPFVRL